MSRPMVIITVNGGVAEYHATEGVKVILVDYDNLQDDTTTRSQVQKVLDDLEGLGGLPGRSFQEFYGNVLDSLDKIRDEATDDICDKCSTVMVKDCQGNYRCEECDEPCPNCHDGGGPV